MPNLLPGTVLEFERSQVGPVWAGVMASADLDAVAKAAILAGTLHETTIPGLKKSENLADFLVALINFHSRVMAQWKVFGEQGHILEAVPSDAAFNVGDATGGQLPHVATDNISLDADELISYMADLDDVAGNMVVSE